MDDKISQLSPATRASILSMLDSMEDSPITDPVPFEENNVTHERDAGALRDADQIIAALAAQGHGDYSQHRDEIADLWDGEYGLWYGNDEATTEFDSGLKDLRLIQEDHYDQHMDDDEKPSWDDMICSAGDYVFFA